MKTDFLRAVACAVVALAGSLLGGTAMAQDVQLASTSELNNLYARLAELESRVAAGNVAYSSGGDCAAASDCCEDDCCKAGFIGGGEVLWLKAFESDDDFGNFNYEDAFRFWVGYQRADGLGVRFRYFDFDQDPVAGDEFEVTHSDLEIYDTVQIGCHWDLVIGAGIRYMDLHSDDGDDDEITGVGPVVTAELYRHISDRAALYAIGRQSIIVGNGLVNDADAEDLTGMVTEVQLGAQVHRDWNGALLFGRIGWEAQLYHEPENDDESVTLMGGVLSAGIMR
jgi:hypothetical protein